MYITSSRRPYGWVRCRGFMRDSLLKTYQVDTSHTGWTVQGRAPLVVLTLWVRVPNVHLLHTYTYTLLSTHRREEAKWGGEVGVVLDIARLTEIQEAR